MPRALVAPLALVEKDAPGGGGGRGVEIRRIGHDDVGRLAAALQRHPLHVGLAGVLEEQLADLAGAGEGDGVDVHVAAERRSEEHTSELQSLIRISYAVFCLKKKKHTNNK